jgi:hypothetical protein
MRVDLAVRRAGPNMRGMSKLGACVAGIMSLSVIAVAVYLWLSLGDVAMSAAGYLALIAGGLGTLGLGVGLMTLVFYSHRHGFDDRAGAPPVEREKRAQ